MEAIHLYELINFIRFVCLLDCEIAIQLISVEKKLVSLYNMATWKTNICKNGR